MMKMFRSSMTQTSTVLCARLLATTCLAFNIKLNRMRQKYYLENASDSKANRISIKKYQMNSSEQVITVFQKRKKEKEENENFYQIRFTI